LTPPSFSGPFFPRSHTFIFARAFWLPPCPFPFGHWRGKYPPLLSLMGFSALVRTPGRLMSLLVPFPPPKETGFSPVFGLLLINPCDFFFRHHPFSSFKLFSPLIFRCGPTLVAITAFGPKTVLRIVSPAPMTVSDQRPIWPSSSPAISFFFTAEIRPSRTIVAITFRYLVSARPPVAFSLWMDALLRPIPRYLLFSCTMILF